MLQYLKRQAMKLRSGLTKGIVLLLCLATLFSSAQLGGLALIAEAADGDTVTVTVNYVYKSNSAMVAQPYRAQIAKGAAFQKTIEVPYLFNYSIPYDQAVGLGNGIKLEKNTVSNKYSLGFDLPAVNEDITVTLYYVAGKATYTVKHYYQSLEDGSQYNMDPITVELTGDIDAYTQAVANNKKGFRCKGIPQTTIAADGTTVVDIYYDREYYTVVFDVNGGINGPEPIYAKYGTKFNTEDITSPTRVGYKFMGWKDVSNTDAETLNGDVEITENVTYTAQWVAEKGQADYTIVLWGQNANDNEYSYLGSAKAWGNVGNEVTWNEDTLISHVHTDDCWDLTCGKKEHTHNEACLKCTHTHDMSCYGGTNAENPIDADISQFTKLLGTLQNGYVYRVRCNAGSSVGDTTKYDKYYLYFNGTWYLASATACDGGAVKESGDVNAHGHSGYIFSGNEKDHFWAYKAKLSCTHTHTDACYTCGKPEHTHDSNCGTLKCGLNDMPKKYMRDIQPDSNLWTLKKSETVTVDANGSTVLNVYFDRTEFTLTFKYGRNGNETETIKDRWGANVKARFDAIETNAKKARPGYNLQGWLDSTTSKYTNNVMIMPQVNKTLTANYNTSSTKNTMTYYAADLNGDYQEIFTIVFYGNRFTVTADEYYEWEGFTINKSRSTEIGNSCNGAKFYYDRNTYKLEFYSASNNKAEKTENVKYQATLGGYDYTPVNKPDTVEPDAIFVGWYQNPECTGEPFDLSAHVMPSHDIALYAKWVNGLFTVKTFTDKTMTTPYTYDGYNGVQENIVKYTLATAPADPEMNGYQFIGWFYKDGEAEKPFSFTMPITKDYDLYPKFSEPKIINYTVHYYKQGTTDKVADDSTKSVMIGTTVTEKAKMGTELNLVEPGMQNKYYPTNTSTSVTINQIDQEITFFYTKATSVQYTVYYRDANGKDLLRPKTETTELSTVVEYYVPINGYAPRQFSITQDLTANSEQNKIVFIYDPTLTTLTIQKQGCEEIDENQTFLFHVKGSSVDPNTKDIDLTVTVHGNGQTTVTDLPVGDYIITEESGWSWRYTPQSGAERKVTVGVGGLTVQYQNSRTQTQWLDGDNYSVNHFDSKNQ